MKQKVLCIQHGLIQIVDELKKQAQLETHNIMRQDLQTQFLNILESAVMEETLEELE
jgi:hypothetical protein